MALRNVRGLIKMENLSSLVTDGRTGIERGSKASKSAFKAKE
jgi:hypothetical protein